MLERREEMGLSQSELADRIGLSKTTYCCYEAMSKSPIKSNGDWTETALKIADYYYLPPDELWPNAIQAIKGNIAKRTMDVDEFAALESSEYSLMLTDGLTDDALHHKEVAVILREAVATLPPRLANVVRQRFGIDCDERALRNIDGENVSCERTRQLEARALRMLRHPSRSARLKRAVFGDVENMQECTPLSREAFEHLAPLVRKAEIERLKADIKYLKNTMPKLGHTEWAKAHRKAIRKAHKELRELVQAKARTGGGTSE